MKSSLAALNAGNPFECICYNLVKVIINLNSSSRLYFVPLNLSQSIKKQTNYIRAFCLLFLLFSCTRIARLSWNLHCSRNRFFRSLTRWRKIKDCGGLNPLIAEINPVINRYNSNFWAAEQLEA